jgi:hypothetical protein
MGGQQHALALLPFLLGSILIISVHIMCCQMGRQLDTLKSSFILKKWWK